MFEVPFWRYGEKEISRRGNLLREGVLLGVAHDPFATGFNDSGELAASDEWRLWSSGVLTLAGAHVCKVQAGGVYMDENFIYGKLGLGNISEFKGIGSGGSGDNDSIHEVAPIREV
jgi:hypothetical protein